MFKGFQDTSRSPLFSGFPNLNFQMNNEAYGFSGCTFWLDAAYGLQTQTNAASISSWIDRIQGSKWTQTNASLQPVLVLNDTDFNNYPSINFDGADKRFVSDKAIGFNGTMAMVGKLTTIQGQNLLFTTDEDSGSNSRIMWAGTSNANYVGIGVYGRDGSTLAASITSTVENTIKHIAIITPNTIVIDGSVVVSGGSWSPDNSYNSIGSSTASRSFRGKLAEAFFYNNVLSETNCVELSTRLNTKYAIY